MPAAARIRPLDLFSREEWERVSARNDWMGPLLVLHAWAVIAAAMALSIWSPWFIPVSVMLIGARQLGLTILMHDAAHGALHSNAQINDFLGQWLCGAPMGSHVVQYRNYHLKHHKYAQQQEDPDLGLSAPFPITKSSLRRKILRDLTGQTFLKQRKNQFANALGIGIKATKGNINRSQSAREAVIPMLITNAIIFAVLAALGHWWAWFVLWLLPMATWMMMITRLRNIAEHAVVPDNMDPMRHARTTLANPLEGLLLAPYWVNYHCEHHMFMHMPCYRLGFAHRALARKGVTDRMEVRQGYLSVLKMAASLPEPTAVPA
ncbi:MAG: fatty acid desaturase family protein [Hyphomonas sp.]|uniref:fatty acid desaturase family protein n=1 Tax=Hyphomonas sp. TaxID=87 RepID=UPI0035270096